MAQGGTGSPSDTGGKRNTIAITNHENVRFITVEATSGIKLSELSTFHISKCIEAIVGQDKQQIKSHTRTSLPSNQNQAQTISFVTQRRTGT